MTMLFLQTADSIRYQTFLQITSRTVREYCARHGHHYDSFTGLIRGYHPWQATYNRILLLKRLVDANYVGWVCYMDADAYIADLNFDLKGYLLDKDDVALIAADDGLPNTPWWNINAGVLLVNLAHPVARDLIYKWSVAFDEITDDQLRDSANWELPHDQDLLVPLLATMPEAARYVLIDNAKPRLLNYEEGRFIRQVLRAVGGFSERIRRVRVGVDLVLGGSLEVLASDDTAHNDVAAMREAFVFALYRVLLFREPDPDGLTDAVKRIGDGMGLDDALRSCLMCPEFATKYERVLKTYVRKLS